MSKYLRWKTTAGITKDLKEHQQDNNYVLTSGKTLNIMGITKALKEYP